MAFVLTSLSFVVAPTPVRAAGTLLFQNSFNNRTVDGTGTVTKPTPTSGTNVACLTASGNSATLPLLSCAGSNDAQGAGKLRLTNSSGNELGGVIGGASFPTSNGLDVTFNSYQWGGGGGDGMSFLLAAVDPANPAAATTIGPGGGSLGYSPAGSIAGLPNAYLGLGLDVFGNFSSTGFQGTGCTNNPRIVSPTAGAVVARGPGKGLVGYCGLTTTYDGTVNSKVTLRAATRAASVVPVQVLINPTGSSFLSDSGESVAAGTYKVVVKPVGQTSKTLTGSLPTVAAGLYPSSSWLTSAGIPRQLSFGFVGSTGSVTDAHEIDTVKVLTFNAVPQLGVSSVSYAAATSTAGDPVSYVVSASVLAGANENSPITVAQTVPNGVKPVGAYGTGWVCGAPVGQTMSCTTSASSFAGGTALPAINVVAIVTAASITASVVQNSSTVRASSVDANPGTDTTAAAGTRPAAPSGVSVSPVVGPLGGGGQVTVSGTSTAAPTAIEIGTTAEQQAGTPVTLLPCPGAAAAGCFSISGSNVVISSMPARASAAAVTVTIVTLGIAGADDYTYAGAPAAPATPTATAGIGSAALTWAAPVTNGSPITGYVVTPYLGGVAQTPLTFDPAAVTRTITGLTAGGSYTFRVAAINAYGTSAASAASVAVVIASSPVAPTIGAVSAGDSSAVLSWTAPTSNGGTTITGYVVTPYIGTVAQTPQTFTGTATTRTVTGLTPGTAYTFTVAARGTFGTNVLYRVNAGGAQVAATDGGPAWTADDSADNPLRNSGSTANGYGTAAGIDSTVPSSTPTSIFSSERYDAADGSEMAWAFPVASGATVKVRLYFANRYTGTSAVGARVFDVSLEGSTVLDEFDAVRAAGADQTGTMREFTVTSDGTINIAFAHSVENPLVNGIEIIQTGLAANGPASAKSASVVPNQSPTLVFSAPPPGEVGVAYSRQLTVTNGTAPFVWSISSGSLPAGMTLAASTGLLSGTPTESGSFPVTVTVTDASAMTASKAVNLIIVAAPTFTFTGSSGEVTVPYNQQPVLSGGTGPFVWSVSAGSLPPGLTLNTSTGLVAGTPTAAGTFGFTLAVTDSFNQVGNKTVTVVIAALPTLTFAAPAAGQVGVAYSTPLTVTGGTAPLVWSISAGSLPAGLSLNTATGLLSGTPTTVGSSSFTVSIVDAYNKTNSKAATLVIASGPLIIEKTANVASAAPGSVVAYTVTVTNTGTSTWTGATFSDPLTAVLDDATYNANATTTSGTLTYASATLGWSGNVAAGATVTISYSVTVNNPDVGNKVLANTVASTTLGTNCAAGSGDVRCTSTVTVPGLDIAHTAGAPTATPGGIVAFRIVVTNNGQTAYASASLSESLSSMLDDAVYNADGTAGSGSVTYSGSTLSWAGPLAVGASTTITYSLTVRDPDPGNRSLTGTVVSAAAGSSCPSANPAAQCSASVTVLVPALAIANTADVSSATPGGVVGYTVTLSNTGQTAYTGTSVSIALAGALDDATYNGNAVASTGAVVFAAASSTLVWSGNIAIGAVVTITASVTVANPDTGNRTLTTVATSPAAGSTCPAGTGNAACTSTVQVLVPALALVSTADVTTTTPGSVVRFTVVATNTGQTPYPSAAFAVALAGAVDDATYDGNAAASSGTASVTASTLSWSGSLAVGASATITYSLTVKNPDPGNRSLVVVVTSATAGSTCPAGGSDVRCSTGVAVLIPGLTITTQADVATTTPGSVVHYSVTVLNNGQTAYSGLAVTLDLAGTLDDADYNYDATITTGDLVTNPDGTVDWVLGLAPGASATGSLSMTVHQPPDLGDRSLRVVTVTNAPGSPCTTGAPASGCVSTVAVLLPGLTISKSANVSAASPGDAVAYTIVVENTGQTPYTAATFTDSLVNVLTDATYAGGGTATTGSVSYAAPTLTWTGALAAGASATVSYSVTVRDPDPGDKRMTNTVVSSSPASNCAAASTDARCIAVVNILVPGLTLTTTANRVTTVPGATIGYTVTATNSGATVLPAATFTDSLTDVLDDAAYNADVAATSGTPSLVGSTLRWTGALAVGATATVTYSVTVHAADGGDNLVTNTVTSTTSGANCSAGNADPRCVATVPVARLIITQGYTQPSTTPGSLLRLNASFTNTGKVAYTGITISSPSGDTTDDAIPTGDQTASSGTLVLSPTAITWTGNIPVGGVVTVTGTLTVKNPDPGDKVITGTLVSTAPGNNCPAAGTDSRCTARITVLLPELTITKAAGSTTVVAGGAVGYTLTVHNTGQTPYTGAVVTDSLTGVLDKASWNGDATATTGSVTFTAPTLTWTGDLAVGATTTITYGVTASPTPSADRTLVNLVSSTTVGSTCPPSTGNPACRSTVDILTPGLTIEKTADLTNATLGTTVTYTVGVTNSGQTPQPTASFADSLADVLDDATYNPGDTTVTGGGTTTYSGGVLGWTGSLAVGAAATVTYTVTIRNPNPGDTSMGNTVVSNSPGSNCVSGSPDARCTASVTITNTTTLTFTKLAGVATTVPGAVVAYTVTAVNSSATAVTPANFTDSLGGILDDATYNGDAVVNGGGTVSYASQNLSWAGPVAAGATITLTYSVTVHAAVTGDQLLSGTVSSTSVPASNNCLVASTDPRCGEVVPVARLDLLQVATETTTTPGSLVHLTATYTNTGMVDYRGISIASPRADTSDDTTPTGDQTATSGVLVRTATALTWTGDIPIGGSVTVTRSLVVNDPDTGNHLIRATITSDVPGTNCATGSTDARCSFSIAVLTPALTITKVADTTFVVPGGTASYTITVRNSGETAYVAATVADSLVGVLDDATYDANAVTDVGSLTYSSPTLTWTGDLAVGQTATITYTVTARSPATADKTMINPVSSSTVGSTCLPASGNAACRATVAVLTPALTITSTVDRSTAIPGDVVTYTLTAANTGQTPLAASVLAPLAGILDDATYTGDAVVTSGPGTVGVANQTLTYTGTLGTGASATVTYSVRVNPTDTGDHRLAQVVTSSTPGSTCPVANTDPRCATAVLVAGLHIVNTADVSTAKPTDVIHYTGTFTNTGQTAYVGISVSDSFVGALDDATYNGDATATSGSLIVVVGSGRIVWTGDIAVGATVTITGSVTVNNPDAGDKVVATRITTAAVASNCPTAGTDPVCSTSIGVLTPGLAITKASSVTTVTPGGVVGYTITVTNTGETAYRGAKVTDALGGSVDFADDATYAGDATSTSGTVVFTNPQLVWTGDLLVGQSAVITYTVRVDDPDLGDKLIANKVVSDELGSTCPAGGSGAACSTLVTVLVPALDVAVTADRTTTTPGGVVGYTVSIHNVGQTAYSGATVTAALAGVLDDAVYNEDAAASAGGVAYTDAAVTWSGGLALDATAVVTYSVTVADPDPGNHTLTTSVSSPQAGSTCTLASPCRNSVTVLVPGLFVSTAADAATATPGDRVTFTITVANTGQTAYTDTVVSTDLTGVVDDAVISGVTASAGVVGYTAPNLTWTGSLDVGASATITYRATVRAPDPGDKTMSTTVVAAYPGSTCKSATTNSACTAVVSVLIPQLTLTKTASSPTTTPGSVLGYTIVLTNSGQTAYTGAVVDDSLAGVLADAVYDGNAAVVGGGTLTYASPVLRWTGDLLVGATATITYSVTVDDPDTGDKLLTNSVASSAAGSTCPPGSTATACSTNVRVLVPRLVVTKSADTSVVTAGGAVNYTITLANTGETAYEPATFTDQLTGVLDDATYAGDASTDTGTLAYGNSTLSWSGALAVGATATITYSVTVRYPDTGDRVLTNAVVSASPGSTCATGTDAGCTSVVAVAIPALAIVKSVDATAVVAGGTVHYTIQATNTGEADYAAAQLSDPLAGVTDDAVVDGPPTASSGTVGITGGVLTWTGALSMGATVIIGYSVAVPVTPVGGGDDVLTNRVFSTSVGASCVTRNTVPGCATSTSIAARSISLSGLTQSFTLTGLPDATITADGAVTMTVTTNSTGGYLVSVQAESPTLVATAPENTDSIPIEALRVRESGTSLFRPMSASTPLIVHSQTRPSAPGGDAVSNDFQIGIPFVSTDTYSTTLDYIATAQ
jgi:uncharacterized repeat protein (TIGR01451 family)